jgi:hypothetical protein
MAAFIGYIPPLIVLVAFIVFVIFEEFFFTGCISGLGYFVTALKAFIVGGILNLAFLLFALVIVKDAFSLDLICSP